MVNVLRMLSLPLLLVCGFISWLPLLLGARPQTCSGCQAEAVYFILGPFLYAGLAVVPFLIAYLVGDTLHRKGRTREADVTHIIRFTIPLLSMALLYIVGLLLT